MQNEFICLYCRLKFNSNSGLISHENNCVKNPSLVYKTCQFCGKLLKSNGYLSHINSCRLNPNRIIKIRSKFYPKIICPNCGRKNNKL